MKEVREWDEEYLQNLPAGEQNWLEIKGRRGLDFTLEGVQESKVLENLSIQISAIANTGGGTLVYGMTDPSDLTIRQIDDGGVDLGLKGRNFREPQRLLKVRRTFPSGRTIEEETRWEPIVLEGRPTAPRGLTLCYRA